MVKMFKCLEKKWQLSIDHYNSDLFNSSIRHCRTLINLYYLFSVQNPSKTTLVYYYRHGIANSGFFFLFNSLPDNSPVPNTTNQGYYAAPARRIIFLCAWKVILHLTYAIEILFAFWVKSVSTPFILLKKTFDRVQCNLWVPHENHMWFIIL